MVEAVGDRGGGRFVDQPQQFETGEARGVLGGLALCVVEVGRHGDDRAVDVVVEGVLGALAQGGEYLGADLDRGFHASHRLHADHAALAFRRDQLVGQLLRVRDVGQAPAHQALDRDDGVLGVLRLAVACGLADLPAMGRQVAHDGGQQLVAGRIGQAFGHAAADGGDQRVRGAQVDAHGDAPLVRIGGLVRFGNLE